MKKLTLTLLTIPTLAIAQWSSNPQVNTAITSTIPLASDIDAVPDGAGGAFVAWTDARTGDNDIYVQHVSASGTALWAANGVDVSPALGDQHIGYDQFDRHKVLASDGAGGAIVCWADYAADNTSPRLIAQRIDASGTILWPTGGVELGYAVFEEILDFFDYDVAANESGELFVTWLDWRAGNGVSKIFAQKVGAAGVVQWAAGGLEITTAFGQTEKPDVLCDASGGAFFVYPDSNQNLRGFLYAQHLDASGAPLWPAAGLQVFDPGFNFGGAALTDVISDGSGGIIAAWDSGISGNQNIYAQRINPDGSFAWASNGVLVCNATADQLGPKIAGDESGGVFITWKDFRSGTCDIYAQHVNGSGNIAAPANGVVICNAGGAQDSPGIVSDGFGAAIVLWSDPRPNPSGTTDFYSQKISPSGTVQWQPNGIVVCSNSGYQGTSTLITNNNHGAFAFWYDTSLAGGPNQSNVFGQSIYSEGSLGNCILGNQAFTIDEFTIYPNPATASITISAIKLINSVKIIDISGKEIFSSNPGSESTLIDIEDFARGTYFVKVQSQHTNMTKQIILK